MPVRTFKPLRGKRIRVTSLDSCGRLPAAGSPDAFLATDGFVSVKYSAVVEEGAEIIRRKASGALCVNEKFANSFKRLNVEIEFCEVNPALASMVSNAEPYRDHAGNINGFRIAEGDVEKWFSLELWSGLSGVACDPDMDEASGYALTPFVNAGTIGDITIDGENAVSFTMTGAYTKGGNGWGVGPYQVVYDEAGVASFLPEALDPLDHLLMINTGLALPPSADDPQPMVTGGTSTTTTTAATTTTTTV